MEFHHRISLTTVFLSWIAAIEKNTLLMKYGYHHDSTHAVTLFEVLQRGLLNHNIIHSKNRDKTCARLSPSLYQKAIFTPVNSKRTELRWPKECKEKNSTKTSISVFPVNVHANWYLFFFTADKTGHETGLSDGNHPPGWAFQSWVRPKPSLIVPSISQRSSVFKRRPWMYPSRKEFITSNQLQHIGTISE